MTRLGWPGGLRDTDYGNWSRQGRGWHRCSLGLASPALPGTRQEGPCCRCRGGCEEQELTVGGIPGLPRHQGQGAGMCSELGENHHWCYQRMSGPEFSL